MALVRRMDTKESREYWAFIEKTAREVEAMYRRHPWMRAWGEHFFCNADGNGRCNRGNGKQSCREVLASRSAGEAPQG